MYIRALRPDDDRMMVSRIYEESWKHAYRGIIPQAYLDAIPAGRWAESVESPTWKTLVCVEDGELVGTSSFCPSRFEQYRDWGEIVSIYLRPAYMGRGHGRALMDAALSALREQGYARVFLWVLDKNSRAIRFYERYGFMRTDDVLTDDIGGRALREIRYVYGAE